MAMSEESRKEFRTIRECLNKKISWRVVGALVGIVSIVAMLSFTAYSGGQARQSKGIEENSKSIMFLSTSVKVIEKDISHIKEQLKEVKEAQKEGFKTIIEELKKIEKKGGTK